MCDPPTDEVDQYDEQTRLLPLPKVLQRETPVRSSVRPVVSDSKQKAPVSSHAVPQAGKRRDMQRVKHQLLESSSESGGPDISAEGVKRTATAAKQLALKVQGATTDLEDQELKEVCAKLLEEIEKFQPVEGRSAATEAKALLDQADNLLKRALEVLGSATSASAQEMIGKAEEAEKSVTPMLKQLAEEHGFEPIGLEYRLKTIKSLKDKLSRDMIEEGKPLDQIKKNVSDVLRYTASFAPEKLAKGTDGVLKDLQKQGYQVVKLKNTWPDDKISYKGINVQLVTPDGQKMELQFHTPDSFWLKDEGTHDLYEEMRRPDISQQRKKQLDNIQLEMAKLLEKPRDIDEIKNVTVK